MFDSTGGVLCTPFNLKVMRAVHSLKARVELGWIDDPEKITILLYPILPHLDLNIAKRDLNTVGTFLRSKKVPYPTLRLASLA